MFQLLRAVFARLGSDLLLKDQKALVSLRKPFKYIFENKDKAVQEISQVRTSGNVVTTGQIAEIMVKCPTLRTSRDSNHILRNNKAEWALSIIIATTMDTSTCLSNPYS